MRHQTRYSTQLEHMPAAHCAYVQWAPDRLIRWVQAIGVSAAAFIERILAARRHPRQGFRVALGILRLAKHYTVKRGWRPPPKHFALLRADTPRNALECVLDMPSRGRLTEMRGMSLCRRLAETRHLRHIARFIVQPSPGTNHATPTTLTPPREPASLRDYDLEKTLITKDLTIHYNPSVLENTTFTPIDLHDFQIADDSRFWTSTSSKYIVYASPLHSHALSLPLFSSAVAAASRPRTLLPGRRKRA